jgi:excisionase family DNA binding protein
MAKTNHATFSIPEAARQLGFTLKYVYDLVYSGRIKADKVAGRWRIPVTEIEHLATKRGRQ